MTRVVLVALLLAACPACPGVPPSEGSDDVDAGLQGSPDFLTDGGEDRETCEAGPCPALGEVEACAALVTASCGGEDGGPRCDDAPGCEAATLLARYEGERCVDAIDDDVRFPDCTDTSCGVLVARVCGADSACRDAPGCDPAQQLLARSVSADAGEVDRRDALDSCAAALQDEDVFAPCG
jgi:hypothetical protein